MNNFECQNTNRLLRSMPAMNELLDLPDIAEFSACMGREQVKKIISEACDEIRSELHNDMQPKAPIPELILGRVMALLKRRASSSLRPAVNATGVVIHTNLGRAPLAPEALKALNVITGRYNTLEYSPENGGRQERNTHIETLICQISGAEAALVVNNNAAAVLLALSSCAAGREVIVSSGELVEIGNSFRIPEILSFSGAAMITVGCTNSTRLSDYRNAITENTALLLKVHPSNYRIEGFTTSTSREELAELAASRHLVFMEDLGSGLLYPLAVPFAHREHSVQECLKAAAGRAPGGSGAPGGCVVTFSGDKLLGGPQIGVIAGSKQLIGKMKSHQLYRALRVDKMTLAAFEATLRLYLTGRQQEIPVNNMIEADVITLQKKAQKLCRLLKQKAKSLRLGNFGTGDLHITVVEANGAIGGGAFPTDQLPGFGVGIRIAGQGAEKLNAAFRTAPFPVITGIRDGQVILHARTLLPGDEHIIACAFAEILKRENL